MGGLVEGQDPPQQVLQIAEQEVPAFFPARNNNELSSSSKYLH